MPNVNDNGGKYQKANIISYVFFFCSDVQFAVLSENPGITSFCLILAVHLTKTASLLTGVYLYAIAF